MSQDIYQASARQQIAMLRETTKLTGALHEAQVMQLKMWPMVVFDHASTSAFTWDPDTKTVKFNVTVPEKAELKPEKWWSERVTALNSWVHELLGEAWLVEVTSNGLPSTLRGKRKIIDVDSSKPGREGK